MIHLLIGAIVAAVGAATVTAVVLSLRTDITQQIAQWLRARNLHKSFLMSAVVIVDRIGGAYRAKTVLQTVDRQHIVMEAERSYTFDQIDDPDLRRDLQAGRTAQKNVLALLEG